MKGRSLAEVLTGAVVLAVAFVFLGYAILHGGRAPVTDGIALSAAFDRVDGLNQGADVKIGGVKVGTVTGLAIDPQSFQAVATTSAGLAFMLGRRDGEAAVTCEEALANARDLLRAVDLPVSADLEDGFGPGPEDVEATLRGAIAAGLCGCTIEDTTAGS